MRTDKKPKHLRKIKDSIIESEGVYVSIMSQRKPPYYYEKDKYEYRIEFTNEEVIFRTYTEQIFKINSKKDMDELNRILRNQTNPTPEIIKKHETEQKNKNMYSIIIDKNHNIPLTKK